ncbi:MAG: hypothetical protein E7351_00910 [Clostridiales bacterium]|nr:hypothetical protein [Clostridiales bacterium]
MDRPISKEILDEQMKLKNKNKKRKIFDIFLAIFIIVAIIFTIMSFVVPKNAQLGFAITSIALYVIYIVIMIVKSNVLKK